MSDPATRRKWVSLGEVIAMLALIVSALGLWKSWSDSKTGPTEVIEKKPAVPLVLRARAEDGGERLVIEPVESAHALDSLTLTFPGKRVITTGSGGELSAGEVERALGNSGDRKGSGSVRVSIEARYVEGGTERRSARTYTLRYRWEGGGLFDDRDLRLTGLSRS